MTYEQHLWITIIDKGALALLILLVGFGLDWYLEKRRSRAGLQETLATERAKAYTRLWTLMDQLELNNKREPDDEEPLPDNVACESAEELDKWYFAAHGAMYLSYRATKLFFAAKRNLVNNSLSKGSVKDSFSKLRTQMKRDCGIYSSLEAKRTVVPK